MPRINVVIRDDLHRRVFQVKGRKSWDEFINEALEFYLNNVSNKRGGVDQAPLLKQMDIDPDVLMSVVERVLEDNLVIKEVVKRVAREVVKEYLKDLQAKYEQISKELGRVEVDLALLMKRLGVRQE